MYRKYLLLFGMLFLLASCEDEPIAGDEFFKQINELQGYITDEDWESSIALLNELNTYVSDNFWKLQLLGDEEEYEGIQESINKLSVLIRKEELTQALLEIATIKTYLKAIYSL
ncbi:DUF4363 family protein [Ornithinibacillus scapharcae]|uniref:DUF4363 family protein n=1 Tax=Ornithinibacillus scapharcae TaxID=1147159 RepID=UPI000225B8EC|nr:DUF4363 family protein [Ornithinibacillus scapharcae]